MLEPTGPLPPEIYWRRRALAIGAAVVVLGLIVWFIASLSGGSDDTEAAPAGVVAAPATTSALPSPSSSATDADSGGSGGSGDGAGGSGGSGGSGGATDSAAGGGAAATTSGAPAPVISNQCPDQSLAIKVTPEKATYRLGEEPVFTVVITNIGSTECQRDVGAGLQQALVYTLDNQRIWSNVDCFPNAASDLRTFKPGEQAGFTVKWSGTNSVPGCGEERIPVGVGAYQAIAQLGELKSVPEPFNITG
ncbi:MULTISPECIES: hypothetical protein [unclassified Rhodococcus (in: high G+C Gram-positive bacteria)]|uniref:hypothetical protein n=1 Tax=unclassified Rhodococcus (in: high G+C Gram-positive bacteria) TaxID=192944 RepID=UPI000B9C7159|nr:MULTISPECIES: hypothetical protein [unclassified Rhodococcus (in: high G+C Gram-positive bacteria)]MDV8055768.1 hypothetical protein [Rhodococcus sp. IEGM 1343]OZF48208.1 hypothetical protein CH291_13385 [Rhodococcus sp. 14-1411-2a]